MHKLERSLISERTYAGLKAAKARGRNGGRLKALTGHQLKMAERMLDAPNENVQGVADHFGVARSTFYRLLRTSYN